MRRDYFDATVRTIDEDQPADRDRTFPTVVISYDGPDGLLTERLQTATGRLDAGDVDVSYRLTSPADADETAGVLSIADRLTGEFVMETDLEPDAVRSLVESVTATNCDEDARYRVRLEDSNGADVVYDKGTLLVYDADGSLLRHRSLIPGGVEL